MRSACVVKKIFCFSDPDSRNAQSRVVFSRSSDIAIGEKHRSPPKDGEKGIFSSVLSI
jgi:hypothetical protein